MCLSVEKPSLLSFTGVRGCADVPLEVVASPKERGNRESPDGGGGSGSPVVFSDVNDLQKTTRLPGGIARYRRYERSESSPPNLNCWLPIFCPIVYKLKLIFRFQEWAIAAVDAQS